jgi:hypothetical protein
MAESLHVEALVQHALRPQHILSDCSGSQDALISTAASIISIEKNHVVEFLGNDVIVGDRTIDVHIRKLREKLGDDFFKTIKGVGYKFEP